MKVDIIITEVECLMKDACILLIVYLCVINAVALVACGVDKWRAIHGRWRISERCLMLFAAFGGSIGMWGGMYFFRHKTKHPKFYIGVPAILIIQIIIVVLVMMKIYHVW